MLPTQGTQRTQRGRAQRRDAGVALHLAQHYWCGETVVLSPTGVLDVRTAPAMRRVLLERVADGPRSVVVDLSRVTVTHGCVARLFPAVWSRSQSGHPSPLRLVVAETPARAMLQRSTVAYSVPIYASVADALAADGDPPLRLRAARTLPARASSAALARQFVEDACERWPVELAEQAVDDAVFATSELVENCVAHTPVAEVRLRVEWTGRWLIVAVTDDDPQQPRVRVDRRAGSSAPGNGLWMLAQLSRSWGWTPRASGGKTVWATFRADGSPGPCRVPRRR